MNMKIKSKKMTKKSSATPRRERLYTVRQEDIKLTAKMVKQFKALKHRKVDLTDPDAPEITNWEGAMVGKFYRPLKKQITIRIDADVLEWFKHAAKQYQTLINQACREYIANHTKAPNKKSKNKHT